MTGDNTEHQPAQLSETLSKAFGHPHHMEIGEGVFRRLVTEGYHRELGARPMRNVISRRLRNAVAQALIDGVLVPGVKRSIVVPHGGEGFRIALPRDTALPALPKSFPPDFGSAIRKASNLKGQLRKQVIGQETATDQLAEAIIPGELGLTPAGMPRSMVLICGPTGTGKTKAIIEASQYLYGSDVLARIDMGEFSTEVSVPRLLGENRQDCGFLGEQIEKLDKSGGHFLLLDEIEKGHPKVTDMLLGMEAARITLANGNTIDLSKYHIFATSNLGARDLVETSDSMPERARKRIIEDAAKEFFRPEILARFSALILYKKLTSQVQRAIGEQMMVQELGFLSSMLGNRLAA
ncbi:hypothetical protein OPIT5_00010 (plasmid) [Opitutaceae bacterium TAV5]|nr:hypothetical protein OPIT5_00010 [Opitutaceae bacterium TAV5]